MRKFLYSLFVILASICVPAFAQTAAPVAATPDIVNLYMAGASYNAGATPSVAGSALYAHEVASTGTYAFTLIDVLPSTVKPFTVTTSIGAGIAQKVYTVAGVPIFVPSAVGISYTGTNTGWAWSTGGGALFKLKGSWYAMPTVRMLKSSVSGGSGYQPILGVLFGWGQ